MHLEIAAFLQEKDHPACAAKAHELAQRSAPASTISLRNLHLNAADAVAIAGIIQATKEAHLQSLSFSYNTKIGDEGISAIAESLPSSIREIGLVSCGMGDLSATVVLNALKALPHLQMICLEQNNLSDSLKQRFKAFGQQHPMIVMVV